MSRDDALPVIVGVGQVSVRAADLTTSVTPTGIITRAIREALTDAGMSPAAIDGIYLAHVAAWRYADAVGAVAVELGSAPAIRVSAPSGGDYPTRLLAQAAADVHKGRIRLAVVAGGEAARSRSMYARAGALPPWPEQLPRPVRRDNGLNEIARAHGLTTPTAVYPLFEVARRAAADKSPQVGQDRSARIQAGMSCVAEHTDGAWLPKRHTPEEIATPGAANRWVAWPYPKLMCANPQVDQAAAAILTTVGHARRLGMSLERAVYVGGGTGMADEWDVLARPDFARSPALAAVLSGALDMAGRYGRDLDELELYSCFPVVPWSAAVELGVSLSRRLTTAGGLTFFGGPASSYMACATTALVRRLRDQQAGATGLLYGNGLFMTKHHALVVSTAPPPRGRFGGNGESQEPVAPARAPALAAAPAGRARVETSTVLARADGGWATGVVIGRLESGARFVANTPRDENTFATLTSMHRHPVGLTGYVTHDDMTGLNTFTLTGDTA